MLIIIVFIYLAAGLFLAFIIYDYLSKGKKRVSTKYYSFIQTISVIFTCALAAHSILLSISSLRASDESNSKTIDALNKITSSTNKVKFVLDTVSYSLSFLPPQIDSFSVTFNQLNKTILVQQIKFVSSIKTLEDRIKYFESSISKYQDAVNKYGQTIDSITRLTNQQLEIWEKQQEITKKELNRKPGLFIEPDYLSKNDSVLIIDGIRIANTGNIEANIQAVLFFIPKLYFNKIEPQSCVKMDEDEKILTYQWSPQSTNMTPFYITEKAKILLKEIKFYYKYPINISIDTENFPMIGYSLSYISKYTSTPFLGMFNSKKNIKK